MFGKPLALFRVYSLEVKLDPSWVFLAFLITWSLAVGLFPANYPGLSGLAYWTMAVVGALGLFISILLHEMSHSLVAIHDGLQVKGITLFLFGGVAEMEGEPGSPRSELRMAVVGPLVSILLGVVGYGLLSVGTAFHWPDYVNGVISYLALINLILAGFNLIPAFPLDGGRLLRAGLWKWKRDYVEATRLASTSGTVFGWILVGLGVLSFLRGNWLGGIWWALIGTFLRSAANLSYRQVIVNQLLQGEPLSRFLNPNPLTISPDTTLDGFVDQVLYEEPQDLYPVVRNGTLEGCLLREDLKNLPRPDWPDKRVGDMTSPCPPSLCVNASLDAAQALKVMQRERTDRLLILEGPRLLGEVTLKDMLKRVSNRLELEGYGREAA